MPKMRTEQIRYLDLKNKTQLLTKIREVERKCRSKLLLPYHHQTIENFTHAVGRAFWLLKKPQGTILEHFEPTTCQILATLCSYPYNDYHPATMATQLTFEFYHNMTSCCFQITRKPTNTPYPYPFAYGAFGEVEILVPGKTPNLVIWKYAHQQQLLEKFTSFCIDQNVSHVLNVFKNIRQKLPRITPPHAYLLNKDLSTDLIWDSGQVTLVLCVPNANDVLVGTRHVKGGTATPFFGLGMAEQHLRPFCEGRLN